jgi:serine/threonine protein kinase
MSAPKEELPQTPPALAELSGAVLDERYELGSVLGAGGMGAVFQGKDLRLGRPVAIKVMRPVFAGHDEYIKRFLREAQTASKVRHRNVVVILDYGKAKGGLVYLVMEFLVGEDLEQLLREHPERRLPWAQECGLLIQIASGLKAAHWQGVIHRDIKPANCFLTEEDDETVVKLVDFGIAKLDNATQTQQLTGTAQVLGTPSYIAPEMLQTQSPASPQSTRRLMRPSTRT